MQVPTWINVSRCMSNQECHSAYPLVLRETCRQGPAPQVEAGEESTVDTAKHGTFVRSVLTKLKLRVAIGPWHRLCLGRGSQSDPPNQNPACFSPVLWRRQVGLLRPHVFSAADPAKVGRSSRRDSAIMPGFQQQAPCQGRPRPHLVWPEQLHITHRLLPCLCPGYELIRV